jgi:hypothetical protein
MSINVSAARRVDRPDPRYVNSSQVFKESNNNQGDLAVPEVLRRRNNLLAARKSGPSSVLEKGSSPMHALADFHLLMKEPSSFLAVPNRFCSVIAGH